MKKYFILIIFVLITSLAHTQTKKSAEFFMILTDPQLGMASGNKDIKSESALLEKAIAMANALKPAFVVVCGDLTHDRTDTAQINAYKRITGKLNSGIPLYNVPGNHDVGEIPDELSIQEYHKNYGPDHYSFQFSGKTFIVINSGLAAQSAASSTAAKEQDEWIRTELKKAKERNSDIIIFQHHPWFVNDVSEADSYRNLPTRSREIYLPLFVDSGVKYIFCGHHHCPVINEYKGIEMVINGSSGKSLCLEPEQVRLVHLKKGELESEIRLLR